VIGAYFLKAGEITSNLKKHCRERTCVNDLGCFNQKWIKRTNFATPGGRIIQNRRYRLQVMHDIEPHFRWREYYCAEDDPRSPFAGRVYSEFDFTNKLYNFFIHPQWDAFGSSTLYGKILFADYEEGYVLMELIGEWNDTLHNDIMFLKRNVADPLMAEGISRFVFFCENLLNFHASIDDDYYAEWHEELLDEGGWVALVNIRPQVEEELLSAHLDHYLFFGPAFNDLIWRNQKPAVIVPLVEAIIHGSTKRLQSYG
jgi:hypothetical protein